MGCVSFSFCFFRLLDHNAQIKRLFQINTELKGMAPENGLPISALLTKIGKVLLLVPILSILLSIPTLIAQKPVGVFAGFKSPGRNE